MEEFNSTEFKSLTVQNLTQSMSLTVESLKELWAKEFLPNIRNDKHAPIRLASQSKQRQLNKPWLTKGILKSYFTLLKILKLENIFKLKIGTLVHKIQYQKKDTPPALYDLVQPASAVHNYNTRYATNQNLCRPFSRTNYGLARFSVVASQTWEATPTKIKCLPLNSFKKEYKLFLLDSQYCITSTHL